MPSEADHTAKGAEQPAANRAAGAAKGLPSVLSLWLGLGSLWICLQFSGFYPLSAVPGIGEVAAQTVARMHLAYAGILVAFAVLALAACRSVRRLLQAPWSCAAMGACGVAGHGLLVLADPSAASFAVQAAAGSVLTGCFIALAVLMWGIRSSAGSTVGALCGIAASYAVSQAVLALYCACGFSQACLMMACPVVCALGCWACGSSEASACRRDLPEGGLRTVPWHMVVPALFLIYFCVIFVRLLVTSFNGDTSSHGKALAAVLCLVAFVAVLAIVRFAPVNEEYRLAVSFAFLAVLYMAALVAMLLLDGHENYYVRRALVASEHCVDALVWMALAYAVAARGASALKAFGFYLIAVAAVPWVLSFDAFYLCGLDRSVSGNELLLPAVSIASFVAALGLVGFLLISLLRGSRFAERTEADGLVASWSDAVGAVLGEAGLTPRELDVALLVYRGYSARRVGDELGLSEATVKSYTSHVYRKLDVHSKQEYIAYVERRLEAAARVQ